MKPISDLRISVVISMFDEQNIVRQSIAEIKRVFKDPFIVIIQSDDGSGDFDAGSAYERLPNLAGVLDRIALPAAAITRNFSRGFSKLDELGVKGDLVVALTGDTLITDATSFYRRFSEMVQNNYLVMGAQPFGASLNGVGEDGGLVLAGRIPQAGDCDFICCLWFTDGLFFQATDVFRKIAITNTYTSEQCLGDEFARAAGVEGMKRIGFLNSANMRDCYSYTDGVQWHAKNNGQPGRG